MLLFMDGMHHYATGQVPDKWTTVYAGLSGSSPTTSFTVTAEGRSANAIKMTCLATGGTAGYLEKAPLKTHYGTWSPTNSGVYGMAIKVQDLTKLSTNAVLTKQLFSIYEGGGRIFYVILNPNGTFSHYFHEEAPLSTGYVGSSIQGLRTNTWAYIEFKWTIDLTEGRWETWMNTTKVFDITNSMAAGDRRVYGSSTSYSYLGVWDAMRTLQLPMISTTNSAVWICDVYLADQELHSTDYVVSDVQHDASFGAIYPEAEGDFEEWTPLAGDNNANVREHPPDEDTSYVSASASGVRDRHEMNDVPSGAVILAYQSLIRAKKTSDGSTILDPVLRIGGTDYVFDGQGVSSTGAYEYLIQPHDNNPATSAQLLEAEANAMQAGYNKEV